MVENIISTSALFHIKKLMKSNGFECMYEMSNDVKLYSFHKGTNDLYLVLYVILESEKYTKNLVYKSTSCWFYHKVFKTHFEYWIDQIGNREDTKSILRNDYLSIVRSNNVNTIIVSEDDVDEMIGNINDFLENEVTSRIELLSNFNTFINWCKGQENILDINKVIGDQYVKLPLILGLFNKDSVIEIKMSYLSAMYNGVSTENLNDLRIKLYHIILSNEFKLWTNSMIGGNWYNTEKYIKCEEEDMGGNQPFEIFDEFFSLYFVEDKNRGLYNSINTNLSKNIVKNLGQLYLEQNNCWIGAFNETTIIVGNHDEDELIDATKSDPENSIASILMNHSKLNHKVLFLHLFQEYNIISYVAENGKKRIKMMHLAPEKNKMVGEFTEEEDKIILSKSNKFNCIEKIFNLHLKEMTGLDHISDARLLEIEMVKI